MGTKDGSNKKAGSGSSNTNNNNNTITPNASEVAAATEAVQDKIGFTKTKHPTEGIVNTYAFDSEGNQTHMYGGTLSTATNEYLKEIGEATYNEDTGSYNLTAKGWALKYGSYTAGGPQNPTGAVGGNTGGVMGNTPLSEQMFEHQNKIKNIMLAGLSVISPFPVSSVLAHGSEQAHNQKGKYGEYLKSFQASQTANMAMGTVTNQNTETANLGMGDTEVATNTTSKKKGKTHKKTGNFLAGTGVDESTSIREFFA